MTTEPLPASLCFLTDAAHLLATAAPETSAYLMTQRNALMFNNELPYSDVQRQHVCGCCGHIMLPGKESTLKFSAAKIIRKRSKKFEQSVKQESKLPAPGVQKHITCGMCGRYTRIGVPSAPAINRRVKSAKGTVPIPSSAAPMAVSNSEAFKESSNARSKKRAKNRKQGLQAMLQQSKSSSSSVGRSLSLTDFMKK